MGKPTFLPRSFTVPVPVRKGLPMNHNPLAHGRFGGNFVRAMKCRFLIIMLGALALAGPVFAAAPVNSGPVGSFTLVQPMKQFRRHQSATLLLDGNVLVAGGRPFDQA